MEYESVDFPGEAISEAIITRNDPAQVLYVRLAAHPHFNVRGNALLGFGHLARRFGRLDRARVEPIIRAGLADPNEYVRGQAVAAADDLNHFLGWHIAPAE